MVSEIITPMIFTTIKDVICELLANERDNQIELAKENGADDETIAQDYDFTIFPKRFRFPDINEMPCVFVYFNEINFTPDIQDVYEYPASGKLQVEIYAVGENETDDDGEIIKTADENASDRLEYLTAQVFKILCSEETNIYEKTNNLVGSFILTHWKRVQTPDETNVARTVLGALLEFDVKFDEPTNYAPVTEIKEIYTNLDIRDEYINPYIKVVLSSDDTDEETDDSSEESE